MTPRNSTLSASARKLIDCLNRETRLARAGALSELEAVAAAKQEAFAEFKEVRLSTSPGEITDRDDLEVLRELMGAANENALVLEAVASTLGDTAKRLHDLLATMADPGTYGRFGAETRHVPAVRINAIA